MLDYLVTIQQFRASRTNAGESDSWHNVKHYDATDEDEAINEGLILWLRYKKPIRVIKNNRVLEEWPHVGS